jgi:hypothetical protein
LCLHWSLIHQALHVPPEKGIQCSQVRGAGGPGVSHHGGPGSIPGSHVGFVVDSVAPGQVSSKYFSFPCQFSFHQLLRIH